MKCRELMSVVVFIWAVIALVSVNAQPKAKDFCPEKVAKVSVEKSVVDYSE